MIQHIILTRVRLKEVTWFSKSKSRDSSSVINLSVYNSVYVNLATLSVTHMQWMTHKNDDRAGDWEVRTKWWLKPAIQVGGKIETWNGWAEATLQMLKCKIDWDFILVCNPNFHVSASEMSWFNGFKPSSKKSDAGGETAGRSRSNHYKSTMNSKPFHENPDHQWNYYKNTARHELFELMCRTDMEKAKPSEITASDSSVSLSDGLERELLKLSHESVTDDCSDGERDSIELIDESVTRVPFSVDTSFCPIRDDWSLKQPGMPPVTTRRRSKSMFDRRSPPLSTGVTPTPQNSPR